MSTIALHLGGPLQSWATRVLVKTRVDTDRVPGESALRGMLAACFGIERGQEHPEALRSATFKIIQLKEGQVIRDYQIIGNRAGEEEYLRRIGRALNGGKSGLKVLAADNQGGNSIVRRTYLGDASFLVLITGANEEATDSIYSALKAPRWTPYLGRKAFAPTFPFLLGIFPDGQAEDQARLLLEDLTSSPMKEGV